MHLPAHSDNLVDKASDVIKDKVNSAIEKIEDKPDHPDAVDVVNVFTLHNKAVLLQLNSKQSANWLEILLSKSNSLNSLLKMLSLLSGISRKYNIIVPHTPIIFNPKNDKHLCEIKECNNLNQNTIEKARWIKPVARRQRGQTHAYAIMSLHSPNDTNQLIRSGIVVFGTRFSPTKLRHEPIQCMKCCL
jgi:hypothetical protein